MKRLEYIYDQAFTDVSRKISDLQFRIDDLTEAYDWMDDDDPEKAKVKSMIQSKIYQKQYQEQLQSQLDGILRQMQTNQYLTVSDYLNGCYTDGFIGSMFDLHGQGIPLVMPINQEAMVRAVQLESKISQGLYTRLGEDVGLLKKRIASEVSRCIATGASYAQTAKSLAGQTAIGKNRAIRIVRTEGHRIQNTATMDAMEAAIDRGADLVKQWDATLDGKTRESHVAVDGEIKEQKQPFSNGLQFPGDPAGGAAEVVNCRCALLQRARWAVGDKFTKWNNFTKQLETFESPKTYSEFKKTFFSDGNKRYMNYVQKMEDKYQTRDLPTLVERLKSRERTHYERLLSNNPVFNPAAKPQLTIADISQAGTEQLMDMYEYRRKKFGLNLVPAEELAKSSLNPVTANYEGVSLETAEAFNEVITELGSEYLSALTHIEVGAAKDFFGKGVFATTQHNTGTADKHLVLNPVNVKDYEKMTERIRTLSQRGWCAKVAPENAGRYVATHEFAHTLLDMETSLKNFVGFDGKETRKVRKQVIALYDEYKKTVISAQSRFKDAEFHFIMEMTDEAQQVAMARQKEFEAIKISDYSLQSADEFFAEAFTHARLVGTDNVYVDRVMGIIDEHYRRR